jgi:ribosomal protein L32
VSGELQIAVSERFGDRPISEDDLYPIVDDTIDLGPMVRDAIVLELPMAPLCRDDCRGLCPQCGADRNESECGCVAPANWVLRRPPRSVCPHCQSAKTPHVVCPSCGWYKGRQAVEVD